MWRCGTALLLAASALFWERGALAQPAPPRRVKVTALIAYEVVGHLPCPSKETFVSELATRLTYDPSDPRVDGVSIGRFNVVVRREVEPNEGPRNVARVRFWNADGVEQKEQLFKAPSLDARGCDYLVEKDVVASLFGTLVALALASEPPPTPPASRPPPPAARPDPPAPQELPPADPAAPPPPPRTPIALRIGAAATGALVTLPREVAWGMKADLGLQVGPISVAGQARYVPPAGVALATGEQVSVGLITGGLVVCGHVKWLAACGVGEMGTVQISGPLLGSNAYAQGTLGPRLGLEVPFLIPGLYLQIVSEYLKALGPSHVNFIRGSLDLPAVNAGGGLGLVYTLPLRK